MRSVILSFAILAVIPSFAWGTMSLEKKQCLRESQENFETLLSEASSAIEMLEHQIAEMTQQLRRSRNESAQIDRSFSSFYNMNQIIMDDLRTARARQTSGEMRARFSEEQSRLAANIAELNEQVQDIRQQAAQSEIELEAACDGGKQTP